MKCLLLQQLSRNLALLIYFSIQDRLMAVSMRISYSGAGDWSAELAELYRESTCVIALAANGMK